MQFILRPRIGPEITYSVSRPLMGPEFTCSVSRCVIRKWCWIVLNSELSRDHSHPQKKILALFLACIIYNFPDNPFYNLARNRFLEPFHSGAFLVILVVCPGTWHCISWTWLSTAQDQVCHEISTSVTFLAGSPVMPIQTSKKRNILYCKVCSV